MGCSQRKYLCCTQCAVFGYPPLSLSPGLRQATNRPRKTFQANGKLPFIQAFEELENTGDTAAAQCQCWYNVEGGLIIVKLAWSPSYIVGENSDPEWWPEGITQETVTELETAVGCDVY